MTGFDHHAPTSADDSTSVVATVTGSVPTVVTVTAVVVTRGYTPYLKRTLPALQGGRVQPDEIVVVDTAATEATARYDDLHLGAARFVAAPHAKSFGQSVDVALGAAPSRSETTADGSGAGRTDAWVWLLHDDSAPEPEALAELLRAVELSDTIAIAGAKQRPWDPDPSGVEHLLEVGVTTTALGRRVAGVGPFDIDQGQFDGEVDVLAVGLAGALVRRSRWNELGGTDPELGPFGDGLDLSLRARRAGHRVVVVPSAVVRHAQASLNGQRRDPDAAPDPAASFGARRRSELHARLTSVAALMLPFAAVAMVLWAPVRAMYRLVVKQPGLARDELVAPLWALVRVPAVARARRRAARTASVPRRVVRKDFVIPARQVFAERRERRSAVDERTRSAYSPTQAEVAELRAKAVARRSTLIGVVTALVGLSVVLFMPLFGHLADGGRAVGGALLPAGTSLVDVWRSASSGLVAAGMGAAAPADPFGWFILAITTLAGGSAQTAVNVFLVCALVIAGVGAWFAAGVLTRSTALRAWVVLVWVAAPGFTEALSQGRMGGLLVHAALPCLILGVVRAVGAQRVDVLTTPSPEARSARLDRVPASLGAAAGAGIALIFVAAGAPVLLPVVCLGLLIAAPIARRSRRYLCLVPVPALVLFAPFYAHVAQTASEDGWRLLFADPGLPLAFRAAEPWQNLLGFPTKPAPWWGIEGTGLVAEAAAWAPFALGGALVAIAIWAVVRGLRVAVIGWVLTALGVATAVASSATVVAPDEVRGWPGPGLSLALAGLLGAAVVGLPRRPDGQAVARGIRVRLGTFGRGAVLLAVVALPAAGLASWTAATLDRRGPQLGEVSATSTSMVSPIGQQMQAPPQEARVLAVDPGKDGIVRYSLLRADGPQAVDASGVLHWLALAKPGVAQGPVPALVAELVSQSTDNIADKLGSAGVGAVLLPAGSDTTERAALTARLDMVAGLERITEGQSSVTWRVAPSSPPSWARIEDGGARVALAASDLAIDTEVEPGGEGRTVVLAANAAAGWDATLNGRSLRAVDPATTGGLQAFELGPDGGRLEASYAMNHRSAWLIGAGAVLVIYALLAVPVRRRRPLVMEVE